MLSEEEIDEGDENRLGSHDDTLQRRVRFICSWHRCFPTAGGCLNRPYML